MTENGEIWPLLRLPQAVTTFAGRLQEVQLQTFAAIRILERMENSRGLAMWASEAGEPGHDAGLRSCAPLRSSVPLVRACFV
jgi:hypothetical protein